MSGRRLVVVGLAAAMVLGVPATAMADRGSGGATEGRFDRPQPGFASPRTELRTSTPSRAGLDPAPLDAAWRAIEGFSPTAGHHRAAALSRGGAQLRPPGKGRADPGDRLLPAVRGRRRHPAARVGPDRDPDRHDLRPGLGVEAVHLHRGDAAGRGRSGGARRPGGSVPAGVQRAQRRVAVRQERRDRTPAAHPHLRLPRLRAAVEELPRPGEPTPRRRRPQISRRPGLATCTAI